MTADPNVFLVDYPNDLNYTFPEIISTLRDNVILH